MLSCWVDAGTQVSVGVLEFRLKVHAEVEKTAWMVVPMAPIVRARQYCEAYPGRISTCFEFSEVTLTVWAQVRQYYEAYAGKVLICPESSEATSTEFVQEPHAMSPSDEAYEQNAFGTQKSCV